MKNPLDEKGMALLKFALAKSNIYPEYTYSICLNEDDLRGDNTLVLRRVESNHWEVFHYERGEENLFATFYKITDAINFFYWMLTKATSANKFMDEFETKTGIIF
jgi:hypothetical protein